MLQMELLTNTRCDLWLEGSPKKRENIMMRPLLQFSGTPPLDLLFILLLRWDGININDVKTTFLNGVIEEEIYIE